MSRPLWLAGLVAVAAFASGCSRSDNPPPTPPSLPPPASAATRAVGWPGVATNHPAAVADPVVSGTAEQLEVNYLQAQDVPAKMQVLDDLSDAEPSAAVAVLSRLFFFEREPTLREEILNQLVYIDGAEAAKIELLTEAVKTNQIASVRYAAVQVMVDDNDPSAVRVLQSLLNDPDSGLRDAATDAIDELKQAK